MVADRHRRHGRVAVEGVAQAVRQPVAGVEALDEGHPRLERHDRAAGRGRGGRRRVRGRCRTRRCRPGRTSAGRRGGRARRPSWRRGRRPGPPPAWPGRRRSGATGPWCTGRRARRRWRGGCTRRPAGGTARGRRCGRRGRGRPRGRAPMRCMPVSTLRWTPRPGRPTAARASMAAAVATVGVRSWATSAAAWSGGCSLRTRIGASMPASRRATPSAVSATPSPVAPAASAARADRFGTVPVAVGLDDGPDVGRRHLPPQHADVVGDRGEVDLGPGPAGRVLTPAPRGRPGARRRGRRRPTRRTGRAGPPRRAATRPTVAACSAGIPVATIAPMIPESTSPVPAVARRASAAVTTRTSPSGPATTVVGPLRSTTLPVAAASWRAASMRSGPGRSPASNPYSPS